MLLNVDNQPGLFGTQELAEIERRKPEGITSQEIISLFQARGVKLSEATFRKYVQLGLLPTSKRVGRKGKHRGSRGVYPVTVVRRINLIKHMMQEGLTLEQIRDSFLAVHNQLESAQEALDGLLDGMEQQLRRLDEPHKAVRRLDRELGQTRKESRSLMKKLEKLTSQLAVLGSPTNQEDQGGPP